MPLTPTTALMNMRTTCCRSLRSTNTAYCVYIDMLRCRVTSAMSLSNRRR